MPGLADFATGFMSSSASKFGGELLGGAQRAMAYAGNIMLPNMFPSWEKLCYLFSIGAIGENTFQFYAWQLGFDTSGWDRLTTRLGEYNTLGVVQRNMTPYEVESTLADKDLIFSKQPLSNSEIISLLNRGSITNDLAYYLMSRNMSGESPLATEYLKLRNDIPDVNTLANYAQSYFFDPGSIKLFGLNTEMPTFISNIAKLNGQAGPTGIVLPDYTDQSGAPGHDRELTWADMAAMNQRSLPSLSQIYAMQHRFYARSMFGKSPLAGQGPGIDDDTVKAFQQREGIPSKWAEMLIGINFNPLSLRYIKTLYAANILKEDANSHEVFHAFRQMGYDDTNANRMKDLVVKTARKDIADPSIKQIDKLYKLGAMDRSKALTLLQNLDFPLGDANAHLSLMDGELATEEIELSLKAIKRLLFDGEFSVDDVRSRLSAMGLQSDSIDRYIRIWSLELRTTRRYISLEKSLTLFKKGYINETQLVSKLNNLKYTGPEINVLITETKNEIVLAQVKALELLAKQNEKIASAKQKAIEKASADKSKAVSKGIASADKAAARAHAEVLKGYSDARMKKWFAAGFMTPSQIASVLEQRGYDQTTIDNWLATELVSKPKKVPNVP